eukprot:TRINITY_DN103348_c0_g1_i1.p1 TRINITY_DN103348_c0_g1~~TRINITY_DN103348_c0_g1_i1.p1  ORF type:complete len:422 (+),score=27.00 TRINITY_DN103348_c0_g1_i1:30-1268(+)
MPTPNLAVLLCLALFPVTIQSAGTTILAGACSLQSRFNVSTEFLFCSYIQEGNIEAASMVDPYSPLAVFSHYNTGVSVCVNISSHKQLWSYTPNGTRRMSFGVSPVDSNTLIAYSSPTQYGSFDEVFAFDFATLKQLWMRPYRAAPPTTPYTGTKPCLIEYLNGTMSCMDYTTGKVGVLANPVSCPFLGYVTNYYYPYALLECYHQGYTNATLFNAVSGEIISHFNQSPDPVFVLTDNIFVYGSGSGGPVPWYAIDINSKKQIWSATDLSTFPTPIGISKLGPMGTPTYIWMGGLSGGASNVSALNLATGKTTWTTAIPGVNWRVQCQGQLTGDNKLYFIENNVVHITQVEATKAVQLPSITMPHNPNCTNTNPSSSTYGFVVPFPNGGALMQCQGAAMGSGGPWFYCPPNM